MKKILDEMSTDKVMLTYEHWNDEVGWVTKEKIVSRRAAEGLRKRGNSMFWKFVAIEELFRLDDDADPGEMDGDAASALASAGWGTDEDYGYFGGDE